MRFLVLIICILSFTCEAQNTFNKRLDLYQSWGDNVWSLQVDSNNIFVVFATLPNPGLTPPWAIGILKLDFSGNIVDTHLFHFPLADLYAGGPGSLNKASSGFILGGSYEDTSGNSQALLSRIKADGDTAWTRTFGNAGFENGWMAKQDDDGGFLLCGQTNVSTSPYNSNALFLKTDSLGNLLWFRDYGDSTNLEQAFAFAITPDGGYVIAGRIKILDVPSIDSYSPWITKLDSMGIVQWDTVIFTKAYYQDEFWSVLISQDGNILATGNFTDEPPHNGVHPYILKLDLDGNVIWEKQFVWNRFKSVIVYSARELPDGSIIVVGTHDLSSNHPYKGFLLKLNSFGDSLWYGDYYLEPNSGHQLRDVYPMPDGGFVACGWINPVRPDTGYQDLWILRVDSMGCELSNCTVSINKLQEIFQPLKVFPVPFSSELNVSFVNGFETGLIKIYDTTGKLVLERQTEGESFSLSTSLWNDGIYLVQYLVNDTMYSVKVIKAGI